MGPLLTVVLAVADGLLIWGYSFTNDQVTSQLTAQQITFPATSDAAFKALPAADQAAMSPYAGQLMTNGAQARVYANNFIAVHLKEIGGGKTYSQLSAESRANPSDAKLAAQVQTVFQGTTLRGRHHPASGYPRPRPPSEDLGHSGKRRKHVRCRAPVARPGWPGGVPGGGQSAAARGCGRE